MDTRIADQPAFRLIGHPARVPLIHHGPTPQVEAHITALPETEHPRLTAQSNTEPAGLLQVSADVDPDDAEGSELTDLHGVAVSEGTPMPEDLDTIEVPPGAWAVFRTTGPYPAALQSTLAATASDWLPSNPWRLRPCPSVVTILDRTADSAQQPPSCGCPSNSPEDESSNGQVSTIQPWSPVQRTGHRNLVP